MKLGIAIPTYNESKNISTLVTNIKAAVTSTNMPCTVLIIDDNSPDGTGSIADRLSKDERSSKFQVQVLHRKKKNGLGAAYIEGFEKLLDGDYTHILQMDADMSHDPKYIPAMVKAAENADFVVGSRYVAGGATPDWTLKRKLLSRMGNLYTRVILGSKIHDYTGGYNLYSRQLLKSLQLSTIYTAGYGFLIELKYRATLHAHIIYEVPIVFLDRVHGDSKIPSSTLLDNLVLVLKLRFRKK